MGDIRILHTADLHLGTPFRGIGQQLPDELAITLVEAAGSVFSRIVDVAIQYEVHVMTIAGDLFDGVDAPVSVQYDVVKQFQRLSAVGIKVVITYGNHDPSPKHQLFTWPDNVAVLGCLEGDEVGVTSVLYRLEGKTVQFSGFSYLTPELYGSQVDKFSRDTRADFSIALYHGQVGPSTSRHAPYAQTSVQEMLLHADFDIFALGHIHHPRVLHETGPLILYPGTPQGRDQGETGTGCAVVMTLCDKRITYEWVPTSLVEWRKLTVDATGCTDMLDVISKFIRACDTTSTTLQLLDVEIVGATILHQEFASDELASVLQEALDDAGLDAFIHRYGSSCVPEVDLDAFSHSDGYLGQLLRLFEAAETDSSRLLTELLDNCDERERDVLLAALGKEKENFSELVLAARQQILNAIQVS